MVTRESRLAEFSTGKPVDDFLSELLCEDKRGTYALPYACVFRDGSWRNAETAAVIEASVIGWRALVR